VLLGPIKAKCAVGGLFGDAPCRGWEITAETCARAMREVGAQKVVPWNNRAWDEEIDGYFLGPPNGKTLPVFCIPAPSGFVW